MTDNAYEPVSDAAGKPETSKDERTWAMLAHLSALSGYIVPFGHIVGPLVVWMIKKDELPAVDEHGKEALNFNISMLIYLIVSGLGILCFIGIVTTPILAIVHIVYSIIAALKASSGESYRYPLTIRFIK